MRTNPEGVKQGPYTYNGIWRGVAVTPGRKVATDLRDMIAHINDDGDVHLIGEYQAGFVEVFLRWDDLCLLYKQAQRERDEVANG